jgi:hypothetical protein
MHMSFGRRAFFGYQVFDNASGLWFVNLPRESRSATRPLWRATPTSSCGSWPKPFGRTEARLR